MLPDTPWKSLGGKKIDQSERYQILEKNSSPQAEKTEQAIRGETILLLVQ